MLGGISIWQLLIVLAIVVLIFGTKKIRNMGGDVGSAVKNFKKAMDDGDAKGEDDAKKVSDDVAEVDVAADSAEKVKEESKS